MKDERGDGRVATEFLPCCNAAATPPLGRRVGNVGWKGERRKRTPPLTSRRRVQFGEKQGKRNESEGYETSNPSSPPHPVGVSTIATAMAMAVSEDGGVVGTIASFWFAPEQTGHCQLLG